ncbi:MAG: GNAT family N-acetyltransferase [Firmicutes bacterium]|jgi:ribosomal protein S18 acetylase RimI-like enzyme|nr:GNAT family N-acetyltransferase [Bacillota bacterium]
MQLARGELRDVRSMAQVYTAAFPESTAYYFARSSSARLIRVVQYGLEILLLLGAEALVVKKSSGEIAGYCIYSGAKSQQKPLAVWPRVLGRALAASVRLRPSELMRLVHSRMIFMHSAKTEHPLPKKAGRILSIAVHPNSQGQGLGTLLLKGALAELEPLPVLLEVRSDNPSAQALYHKSGFYRCGKTKDKLGEWIIMVRPGRDDGVRPSWT